MIISVLVHTDSMSCTYGTRQLVIRLNQEDKEGRRIHQKIRSKCVLSTLSLYLCLTCCTGVVKVISDNIISLYCSILMIMTNMFITIEYY